MAGTAAAVGSLPVTNAVARRRGYEVTPTGVKRKKQTPTRPTRSAHVIETRAGRGPTPFPRTQIVPSDNRDAFRKDDYTGKDLSPWQKRAHVYAAGTAPIVGPAAAAAEAGRIAPPDQRKSAAGLQLGGYYAGAGAGIAAGTTAATAAAAHNPKIDASFNRASAGATKLRSKIGERIGGRVGRLVAPSGPGRARRAVTGLAAKPGTIGRLVKPLAEHPGAASVGGYAGKVAGAGIGSFTGYSVALRRERERNAKLDTVGKAIANGTGLSVREQRKQLERKRHNLGVSMVATGIGATGAGILAARELGPRVAALAPRVERHKAGLERAGLSTVLAGGAVGSYQSARSIGIQHRDLKGQEKVLAAKAYGQPRAAGFRRSAIRTTRKGTLVRVSNTVSKSEVSPGVYKPANQLSRPERTKARTTAARSQVSRQRGFRQKPLIERGHNPVIREENKELVRLRRKSLTPSGRKNLSFGEGVQPEDRQRILDASPRKPKHHIAVHVGDPGAGARGFTAGRAGKTRPTHVTLGDTHNKFITRHEMVHANTNRSMGRYQQLTEDSKKLGREEGRADAGAIRGTPRRGPDSVSGYEQLAALSHKKHNPLARHIADNANRSNEALRRVDMGEYRAMRAKLKAKVPSIYRTPGVNTKSKAIIASRSPGVGLGAGALYGAAVFANGNRKKKKKIARQKAMRAAAAQRRQANAAAVAKLDTTLSHRDAQDQVKQYGLKGPLPRTLDRSGRMKAYEGRYIAAGGKKGERWQRRSDDLDHVTGATIGTAAGAVGAKLAADTHRGARVLHRLGARPGFAGRAGKLAEAAGATGAISELAHRHAQHKASSYKSAPAGVAASALTRLRAYTPDDPQEA